MGGTFAQAPIALDLVAVGIGLCGPFGRKSTTGFIKF